MRSEPLLQKIDAVTIPVPDLDSGLAFYRDRLGHPLVWRNDAIGQAGLGLPGSDSEIVLATGLSYEPNWLVSSAAEAAGAISAGLGRSMIVVDLSARATTIHHDHGFRLSGPYLMDACAAGAWPGGHAGRDRRGGARTRWASDRTWLVCVVEGITVAEVAYRSLASVYEWLVGEELASPAGSARAFETVTSGLGSQARILDCACGIGLLAVGLAQAGFQVIACDASPAMVERTQRLARAQDVEVPARVCRWDQLPEQGWPGRFDAVFCTGNSLAHATGRDGRRAALSGMASVLADGGVLVLTSRNWEQIRAAGSRLDVWDRLVERAGRRAMVVYSWQIPPAWETEHQVEISVAVLQEGDRLQATTERLSIWPFTHDDLRDDLTATGLRITGSTYSPTQAAYVVTAERPAAPLTN